MNQNEITVWSLLQNNTVVMSKDNLINVLENTAQHVIFMKVNQILQKFEEKKLNYDQNLFYVIYNSFRITIYELKDTYLGLKSCEIDRINKLSAMVNYLFISGLLIIGIICAILLLYLISVNKKVNSI